MKKIKLMVLFLSCLFIIGCGHTMYHKVEGTGAYGRIPLPNGSSLIQVAAGDINITSGVLRGGATLDENTSKGGTLGSVSIGRHTHVSTAPAINQGNIQKVLASPQTDEKTKQLLVMYLITRKKAQPPAASVTSVNSASSTGTKQQVPNSKPTKIGIDNIIDKAGDTIVKIAPEVKEGAVKVVDSASKSIQNSVVQSTHNWKKISDNITIIFICCAITIVIIILLIFFLKRKFNQI